LALGNYAFVRCVEGRLALGKPVQVRCAVSRLLLNNSVPIRFVIGRSALGNLVSVRGAVGQLLFDDSVPIRLVMGRFAFGNFVPVRHAIGCCTLENSVPIRRVVSRISFPVRCAAARGAVDSRSLKAHARSILIDDSGGITKSLAQSSPAAPFLSRQPVSTGGAQNQACNPPAEAQNRAMLGESQNQFSLIIVRAGEDEDLADGAVGHDIPEDEAHRRAKFKVRGLPKKIENSC
jgi:hypothetical protein